MISELAVEDLEEMREEGLNPTIRDIIRLNALGLKCETNSRGEQYILPRVAFLGSLAFREPAVGHIKWIDAVRAYCVNDLDTSVAVDAFALSRGVDDLPDETDKKLVNAEISKFVKNDLRYFTTRQLLAALCYARNGADATVGEYAPKNEDDLSFDEDVTASVGAGFIIYTASVGLGLSVSDIAKLTISQCLALQEAALARNGISQSDARKKSAIGDYYAAKTEILSRLRNTPSS